MNLLQMDNINLEDTWVNQYLSGQRPYTHLLGKVYQSKIDREQGYTEKWILNGIASSRLMTFMDHEKAAYTSSKKIVLLDGRELDVAVKRVYISLTNNPLLYVEFSDDGENRGQHEAYEKSVERIRHGFTFEGVDYEYCVSSASQKRTLKGIFVRADYKYSEGYLAKFDKTIPGIDEYLEKLRSLKGAMAVLTAISYGATLEEWSVGEQCISKVNARVGAAATSTISLGNKWRVYHLGNVLIKWSDKIRDMYLEFEVEDYRGNKVRPYSAADVAAIEAMWKEEKLDGQGGIRASSLLKALTAIGYKLTIDDIVGALTQTRWGGQKGTLFVYPDDILDMCKDKEGNYVYKDYDIIIEDSSWKYSPSRFYTGELAPELGLVNISKPRHTSQLNSQFIAALDGDIDNPEMLVDTLKSLVDKDINNIKRIMSSPEDAMARFGLTDKVSPLNDIGIDVFEMNMNNKMSKALTACPDAVRDKWVRNKILYTLRKSEDNIASGRIEIEGATRYIMSSPEALLMTHLGHMNEFTGLMDIVIDDPAVLALRHMNHIYWTGKHQEAVLFRSPCVHPGEPQRKFITNEIPEYIYTPFGAIPVGRLYRSIKDVIVINCVSSTLEALGGADTDGDQCLCVTDPDLVKLRDPRRKSLLVKISSKTVTSPLSIEAIKEDMITSLKNNGIGMITDYATTWRDIQLSVARVKRVPSDVSRALGGVKEAAQTNMKTMAPWIMEDESIGRIAQMDTKSWISVYTAANAALKQLRILQETSINTAKSGVFVEFGGDDPDKNNYNHLAIAARAKWHRPKAKFSYTSLSPMAEVSRYIEEQWKALGQWANETASPLMPGVKAQFGPQYLEVFESVNGMRAAYGKAVWGLKQKKMSKEDFNMAFEVISSDYHSMLTVLAFEYGVDMVAVAAYDASNKESKSKKVDGTSFVWNCFFEELLHTLKFLNSGSEGVRLHKINLDPAYNYVYFKEAGTCAVADGVVSLGNKRIGTTKLSDGTYNGIVVDGTPFLTVESAKSTMEEMTATLSGIKFDIIGISHNDDLVAGGKLTKANVVRYIEEYNSNILITKAIKIGETTPRVAVYIATPDKRMMMIGVIPYEDKVLANALDMKAFVVDLKDKDLDTSFLRVEIVSLKKDLHAQCRSLSGPYREDYKGGNDMYKVRMFVDGSSKGNGKEDAVGGYASVIYIQTPKGEVKKAEISGKKDGSTNNEMELMAVYKGLCAIHPDIRKDTEVHIQSDSKYVVNIFESWIEGWKKAGWKKKDKGEITNLVMIKIIDDIMADFAKVKLEHAPRCSNQWLKRADKLATK